MPRIILYSTDCPKCKVLEKKLDNKNVKYEVCTDVKTMIGMGIRTAPVLGVDDTLYLFDEAVEWVNNL